MSANKCFNWIGYMCSIAWVVASSDSPFMQQGRKRGKVMIIMGSVCTCSVVDMLLSPVGGVQS
jgi:hypothetical protein